MKKLLSAVLCLALFFCMPAGSFAEENSGEWADSTAEVIMDRLGLRFGRTPEMEFISYQISEAAAQMQFTLNNIAYTARLQPTNSFVNISGLECDPWAISIPCTIGWCEANAMMTQQENLVIALCLWYDAAPGLMYSVSACAGELKGLDIQAAAEAVFAPMQDGANGLTGVDILSALIDCTGYAGTAGSSLKNAIAACRLASFAADRALADVDEMLLHDAVTEAFTGLTEDQKGELSFNIQSIYGVLEEAFADYESIRDLFDTAGIAGEMDLIIAENHAFDHFSALYEELRAAGL